MTVGGTRSGYWAMGRAFMASAPTQGDQDGYDGRKDRPAQKEIRLSGSGHMYLLLSGGSLSLLLLGGGFLHAHLGSGPGLDQPLADDSLAALEAGIHQVAVAHGHAEGDGNGEYLDCPCPEP